MKFAWDFHGILDKVELLTGSCSTEYSEPVEVGTEITDEVWIFEWSIEVVFEVDFFVLFLILKLNEVIKIEFSVEVRVVL